MTNFLLVTLLVQAASVVAIPQAGHAKLTSRQSVDCTYSVAAGAGATCGSIAGALESPASVKSVSMTTSTSTKSSTTKAPTSDLHSPSQLGFAKNCNKFYKFTGGYTCNKITSQSSISLDQFLRQPPGRLLGLRWCPRRRDSAITITFMPGAISTCKKFHLVKSGGTCGKIEAQCGITLATFRKWNTTVNADCTDLFLGYYVCVGV
ncbi:hypothetical protein F5B22DRAFT_650598 [Xylaria bambusicola]|uniref:uncharacterized protein n=1 Tax=Xylaria bambusicola TaxID=326684 RepID=UPI002008BA29|nr:uncharacterized protein F5B22DRAFT_650598 [Xylaria bambusicola]KAI0506633.1 hypothetical protein F5B22DRAFT_650598 [Xylaria bambusicola]